MQTSDSALQQIPRWVRRYAQNRSAPVLIAVICFALLFGGIAGFSYLAGMAYRSGQRLQLLVCVAGLLLSLAANTWFSVPRWGGRWLQRLGERYYSREGQVELGAPPKPRRAMAGIAAAAFAQCVPATVAAGWLGLFSPIYLQPVTALYVVPFTTFLVLVQRPRSGYLMLLFPVLYAIHAILIVAGVPILFNGRLEGLNMLLPMFGYLSFSALTANLYSRYALFRLKRLTQSVHPGGGDGRV
jgi:hypothetical protein